jgi:uncharacterized protein YeaO (DUF488 family)
VKAQDLLASLPFICTIEREGLSLEAEMKVRTKRVYLDPGDEDGTRILVDRLWPRGLTKEKAKADIWLKEIAPSTELRKWFGHDLERWTEFQTRYAEELKLHSEQLALLKLEADRGPITLVFGARDEEHNQAVVLQRVLQHK